jgi:3-dehydroquinate synthase
MQEHVPAGGEHPAGLSRDKGFDPSSALTSVPSTYEQSFSVAFDYPVHFTRDVFDLANPLFAEVLDRRGEGRRHRVLVYVDSGVAEAHRGFLDAIKRYFHARHDLLELAAPPQVVPGGEKAKMAWNLVQDVMWTIGNLHLDRQSCVVAIGGGSVLDMVGFAVSIVHRGLRLVRLPTTTLAQNDAGIGVKNGMDEHGQKNFVGTFAPPFAVINDFSFLGTLDFESWIGGVAEAFKVAIIKDALLFRDLCGKSEALRARDERAMEDVVRRSAILHLDHIRTSGDPFEFGSARPLDFGHWAAHKMETMSGYTLGHGQAVAAGIAIDSSYAAAEGLLSAEERDRILDGLERCGLPAYLEYMERRDGEGEMEILDGLRQFREHLGGRLTITLPDGIGRKVEVHEMAAGRVAEAVRALRERARGRRS